MFSKKYFGLVMNFWFSFFLSISMTIATTLLHERTLPFMPVLTGIVQGMAIGFVVGLIIPVNKIGHCFAEMCKTRKGTISYTLAFTLPVCLIFMVILSFAFTLIHVRFSPHFIAAWVNGMPFSFAVAYPVSVVVNPLALFLTNILCHGSKYAPVRPNLPIRRDRARKN